MEHIVIKKLRFDPRTNRKDSRWKLFKDIIFSEDFSEFVLQVTLFITAFRLMFWLGGVL